MTYHYVRPSFDLPFPAIFGLTPEALREQLENLSQCGQFMSQDDILAVVSGRARLPDRALLVTFDDGLREHYEHAWPVLREMGIPAIFFVSTAPLEQESVALVHKIHLLRSYLAADTFLQAISFETRQMGIELPNVQAEVARRQYRYDDADSARVKYLLNFGLPEDQRERVVGQVFAQFMGKDEKKVSAGLYMDKLQLGELAAAGCLGSHAHSHRPLGQLDEPAIAQEVQTSVELLSQWTGCRVRSLAYPYGSLQACSRSAGELARRAGIDVAFTMERAVTRDLAEPMFVPRYAPNDVDGLGLNHGEASWASLPAPVWHKGSGGPG